MNEPNPLYAEVTRLREVNKELLAALHRIYQLRTIGQDASEYALTVEHICRDAVAKAQP